jgi:hypothetical protein
MLCRLFLRVLNIILRNLPYNNVYLDYKSQLASAAAPIINTPLSPESSFNPVPE